MQDKRRQNHQKVNHKTYRLFLLAALVTARERLLNPSEIVSSKFLKNHRCEDAFLVFTGL
jgi:hypothetical protein